MRRFGFVLFLVGLIFLLFSLGQWYITNLMAENRLLPGAEEALPSFLLLAAAGLVIAVVGLCLRLFGKDGRKSQ
ncbi:MAG: hypothetical protein L0Y72_24540 [Gemmataceae bacterium]|nr:hypothetical protein [Gemmataceae bacterium]